MGTEEDNLRRRSTDPGVPGWLSSGLCEGTEPGKRAARGKTGKQAGPASGSRLPGLSSCEPEGLWTGGCQQHASVRPHPGGGQPDARLRRSLQETGRSGCGLTYLDKQSSQVVHDFRVSRCQLRCNRIAQAQKVLQSLLHRRHEMRTRAAEVVRVEIRALLLGLASATALVAEVGRARDHPPRCGSRRV
jgi:hypothetical protein